MPMSGSLGDGRRRQMFASQTSLSSVGAHAYNQSRSASPNKRVQPVQISCYTSSRQVSLLEKSEGSKFSYCDASKVPL